ncbi:MAG: aryl-sulfate sulfotransferase [Paludibacter sp.]
MKRSIKLLAIVISLVYNALLLASPRVFPTGVTIYNPAKAYNSFVLFASPDNITHLIDMNGTNVKQWLYSGQPSEILAPEVTGGKLGHVVLQLENGIGSFSNKVFAELDWDGNVVWQWGKNAPDAEAKQHHDWYRLPNGNTLVLAHIKSTLFGYNNITDDVIYEVKPDGAIVWKWISVEHLNEFGLSSEGIEYLKKRVAQSKVNERALDYLHINDMHVIGKNKWFDAGDKRFDPENIIFDSRNANFVAIIEKKTGKIVWRLGPDFPDPKISTEKADKKNNANRILDQISGQHDAHIIADGLPGAGNLLLFDNQGSAGYPPVEIRAYSRVLEVNPVTREIVWEYKGSLSGGSDRSFFSSYISSARRLPNGNTLINEGMNGRFFQVTPDGEIVWEYVNPYVGKQRGGERKGFENTVYRAQPVPYEWTPAGTPHTEIPVAQPDLSTFRIALQAW